MEVTLPEFPVEMAGQLIYGASLAAFLLGLILFALPRLYGRLFGIVERAGRSGALGELRAVGGFIAGLSLAAFLFQDQPELPLMLGVAFLFGAFGRILALMGDHAVSIANLAMLVIQAGLAVCLMSPLFAVFTPETVYAIPEDPGARLAFFAAAALALIGLLVMFAPRLTTMAPGLTHTDVSETAIAPIRAAGGMMVGVGLMVMAVGSIMIDLAFGFALVASLAGRVVALPLERGNFIWQGLAALATAALAFPPLNYVLGMM